MARNADHDLTDAEAAVLMAATRDAMGAAGALGGSLGEGGAFAARGGAAGGRFGARFTRPRTAATTVSSPQDPDAVREQVRATMAATGVVIEDPNAAGDGSIWGLVCSGTWNMAPALVRVEVDAADAGGSRVDLRATGREGLIKQRIAAKAVDRIGEAIAQM